MVPSTLFPHVADPAGAATLAAVLCVVLIVAMLVTRQILEATRPQRSRAAVRGIDVALAPLLLAFVVNVATFARTLMN